MPDDHEVRRIAAVLDLAWVRTELAPHYSHTGRPSIDPELMIRMLILGNVFAIRSERLLCREVQLRSGCFSTLATAQEAESSAPNVSLLMFSFSLPPSRLLHASSRVSPRILIVP